MPQKPRLDNIYEYDFDLLGLVCSAKDYTLAWHFNERSFLHFVRGEEIQIEFKDNTKILISNFLFESEFVRVFLLGNKLISSNSKVNRFLIPELKRFDFFVRFQSEIDEPNVETILDIAREIPPIQYAMKLDLNNIKSKENLLF